MSALLRSAKFLRIVSGFAKNFTVGSVRNDAENFLENHRPQWQGIDTRFLSTQLSSVHQPVDSSGLHTLDKALQKLDIDIRRTGRITQKDVEGIYEEVKVTGSISSSQSLMLIRCCGNLVAEELPEQRTHLVQNIWQTLQSIGVPMDISHYNALLRVYLENEHQFSPSDFLSYLKTQDVEPNRVTYQRLISRFCLLGDIDGATRILEHMKENKLAINEHVFNSLVVGHARANDLESAKAMISMMKRANLEPSAETFRHLACAYAQQSDMEGVRQTLEHAELEDVQLQNCHLLEIVYSLTVAGNQLHLDELLPRLHRSAGFNQDLVTVILRLVNAGYDDVAFTLLKIMLPLPESPNEPASVGNFFIRQMVRARRPVEVTLQYCTHMRESGMNQKAVLVALHKALQLSELSAAEQLLRALPEHGFSVRPHYFWPLITAAKRASDLPGVLQVLELMRQLNCPVGSETLTEQVLPGLDSTGSWDRVLAQLNSVGVRYRVAAPALCRHLLGTGQLQVANAVADRHPVLYPPVVLSRSLVDAYVRSGDTAVVQLLHHMCQSAPDLNLTAPDVAAAFLQELVPRLKADRTAAVENLLQAMLERGLAISDGCAEAVQAQLADACTDRCCHLLDQLSQSGLAPSGPPADLSVAQVRADRDATGNWPNIGERGVTKRDVELEAEIAAAQAAGEPLAPLLANYFNLMLSMKKLDRALEVKKDLSELGEEHLTRSMMAGLCNALIEAERLDDALQVYHQILSSFPDAHNDWRVLLLARLMLLQGKSDEAVTFLHTQPRDTRKADNRERKYSFFMAAWRLLNVPAEQGDTALVRRLHDVLMDDNYVTEPKRGLLAMLVKAHIAKEDLMGATDELERIFKEYRQLPWKNQLMVSLIQQENPDQLQRVVDLSMEAYGEMSSLYDLAFSFIDCGKTRQAKKVLETPGLRARHERLDKTCARYADNGRITELEDLITVTRDVVGVDRLPMFGHLLRALNAANQPDRALAVWTQMQEEDLAPTEDMLRDLATLLRRYNRTVPFVAPENGRPQTNVPVAEAGSTTAAKATTTAAAAVFAHPPPTRFPPSVPAPALAEPPPNSIKSKLKRAIKAQAIDQALAHREQMQKEQVEPAIYDLSLLVELLVRADRMHEAVDITTDMLGRATFPQPRVFKFLMSRLSADGDVGSITAIGAYLSDELKSATSYDNRLCTAYLNAGRGEQYLDQLEETCREHPSGASNTTYVFPAGGFLGMLHGLPHFYPRCVKLAEEFADRDVMTPINMIWVNHFVNERYDEAQAIFDKYLHNRDIVLFRGVIEKAAQANNLEMTTRLYEMLKPTPISRGAKAVLVTAVIQISMTQNTLTDTIRILRESGFVAEDLKKTVAEQLQREAAANGLLLPHASHTDPKAQAAASEAEAAASEAEAAASEAEAAASQTAPEAATVTSPASQPPPGLPLA